MTSEEKAKLAAIIRRLSSPLEPQPTSAEPRLPKLDGIRAVVFDVYGTLLISGSGDISLTSGASKGSAAVEALRAVQQEPEASAPGVLLARIAVPGADASGSGNNGDEIVAALHDQILLAHSASPSDHPEVEIRDIWQSIVEGLSEPQIAQLATEYECRVNPVWPMPGAAKTLATIRDAGLTLGIISNAQFFTPIAMEELLGETLAGLGFEDALSVWSYAHLQAKPGALLYEQSIAELAKRGIQPNGVLYIGNDMRNDIGPASRVGFRTALFAGDARSLRLREDDPQVAGVEPDAVITELSQIMTILALAEE